MQPNLPLLAGLEVNTDVRTKSSDEKNAFKIDSDGREKVAHQSALFKMAVPSTPATPSPTTTAASVTQTLAALSLEGPELNTRPLRQLPVWSGSAFSLDSVMLIPRHKFITHADQLFV